MRAYVCTQQCVHVYAYLCAHAQNAFQRARVRVRGCATAAALSGGRRKGATFHLGITVHVLHMHITICTRARMYTCMRALVECISACVGVGVHAGARARATGAGVH